MVHLVHKNQYIGTYDNCLQETLHRLEIYYLLYMADYSTVRKYIEREPWITSGILTSSLNKVKLLRKKLSRPNRKRSIDITNIV